MADAPQMLHPQTDVAASDIVSSGGFGDCLVFFDWFSRYTMPRRGGCRSVRAEIVKETAVMYRVRFLAETPSRLMPGDIALVPKWACQVSAPNAEISHARERNG